MPAILDTPHVCTTQLATLRGAGVRTVIRYYARETLNPAKVVRRAEATAIARAGLRLGVVHEGKDGDKLKGFSEDAGFADGRHSRAFGFNEVGQPAGSAVYFGIDSDFSAAQVTNNILPYFRGVARAFTETNGLPAYRVGVYGSGRVCRAVLGASLADLAWIAQSTGWAGYTAFLASGDWSLKQLATQTIAGLDTDPDDANPQKPDIGDFVPFAAAAPAVSAANAMTVNAGGGLRLRAGPGTQFDVLRVLPRGARVITGTHSGDWVMVDTDGDGAFDGYVFAPFLVPES